MASADTTIVTGKVAVDYRRGNARGTTGVGHRQCSEVVAQQALYERFEVARHLEDMRYGNSPELVGIVHQPHQRGVALAAHTLRLLYCQYLRLYQAHSLLGLLAAFTRLLALLETRDGIRLRGLLALLEVVERGFRIGCRLRERLELTARTVEFGAQLGFAGLDELYMREAVRQALLQKHLVALGLVSFVLASADSRDDAFEGFFHLDARGIQLGALGDELGDFRLGFGTRHAHFGQLRLRSRKLCLGFESARARFAERSGHVGFVTDRRPALFANEHFGAI